MRSTRGPPVLAQSKPWATTSDLQGAKRDIHGKKLKSVMFSGRVHVVLIPSISEYVSAGLADVIWWADEEYKNFKQGALMEVKEFMENSHITDSKEAVKKLYLVSDEEREADRAAVAAMERPRSQQQQQEFESNSSKSNKSLNRKDSGLGNYPQCDTLEMVHDKSQVARDTINIAQANDNQDSQVPASPSSTATTSSEDNSINSHESSYSSQVPSFANCRKSNFVHMNSMIKSQSFTAGSSSRSDTSKSANEDEKGYIERTLFKSKTDLDLVHQHGPKNGLSIHDSAHFTIAESNGSGKQKGNKHLHSQPKQLHPLALLAV